MDQTRPEANPNVATHTGATVNGVQTQAEVLMRRHVPTDWPTLTDGLAQWKAQTQALEAADFSAPIKALAMNPQTGGFYNKVKNPVATHNAIIPTHTALGHFTSYLQEAPSSVVENLEWYPTAVRAQMIDAIIKASPEREVTLRTALISKGQGAMPDTRVIRAVVSGKHSKEHGDDLAVIHELGKLNVDGARIRVVKQWDYTHVEVFMPKKFKEVKLGRKVYGKLNFRNSETKGGSYESSVASFDWACLNGMVAQGNGTTISIRHVGDIRYRMAASARTMLELVDASLEEQAANYHQTLPKTRAEAIETMVKRYKLPADSGAALAALWDVDGTLSAGDTVAGAVNAVTRYAQSLPIERAITVEEVAGKVISAGLSAFL